MRKMRHSTEEGKKEKKMKITFNEESFANAVLYYIYG